jgi:hypothetical protein
VSGLLLDTSFLSALGTANERHFAALGVPIVNPLR